MYVHDSWKYYIYNKIAACSFIRMGASSTIFCNMIPTWLRLGASSTRCWTWSQLDLDWEPVSQDVEHDPNLKIRNIPSIDLNFVKFVCYRITHMSWQIEKTEWAMKTVQARDNGNIGHTRHSTKQETMTTLGIQDTVRSKKNTNKNHNTT